SGCPRSRGSPIPPGNVGATTSVCLLRPCSIPCQLTWPPPSNMLVGPLLLDIPGCTEGAGDGCCGRLPAMEPDRGVALARAARNVPTELYELPAPGDPQLRADVRDVLARLSPEHRAALVLRDLEGLDEAAVARLLDVPVGTVKSRLHRARASFRRAWTS